MCFFVGVKEYLTLIFHSYIQTTLQKASLIICSEMAWWISTVHVPYLLYLEWELVNMTGFDL